MPYLNKVTLIGTLTKNPELKTASHGGAICTFTLGSNRKVTTKAGKILRENCYSSVVCYGPVAENCEKYLEKGSLVLVDGGLRTNSFEGADGKKVSFLQISAQSIQFLARPKPKKEKEKEEGE